MKDDTYHPQRIKLGAKDGLHGMFHHLETLSKWKNGETFAPLWVEVSPTSRCNQRCFYCYVDHLGRNDLSIPEKLLVKIFDEMGQFGVKCCELQGTGEPLLNKGVPDAIVAGKKAGMDICLVTNGTLLSAPMLEKIEPCLSFLRVSALAHNAQCYARLHGCHESHFDKVVRALQHAVHIRDRNRLDVAIIATFIVFDFNTPHIVATARLLKDIGVDVLSVKPSVFINSDKSRTWHRDAFHRQYAETLQEAQALSDDVFKVFLNQEYLDEFMSATVPQRSYHQCFGVELETHIDADGKIYPCQVCWRDERFCLGDLTQDSFGQIWGGEEWRAAMSRFHDEIATAKCQEFCCKQHAINGFLYELRHPPRHVNVI